MSDQPNAAGPAPNSSSVRHAPLPPRHGWRGRRYWLAVLSLVLALAAGIAIGAGGAILYIRKTHPKRPEPDRFIQDYLSRMEELISLTPDEKTAVEGIVRVRFQFMEKLREEFQDEIRAQFDETSEEVKAIVGPERYEAWKEYREKRIGEGSRPRRKGRPPR